MSANRLQRWAFQLSAFNYSIQYVRSSDNCADLLSRLPNTVEKERQETISYLNFVTVNTDLPIQYNELLCETEKDEVLPTIIKAVRLGKFKRLTDDKYKPYVVRENELTVEKGILMWGFKIVVPMSLRQKLLRQVHATHMGIVKTKSILRSYVWWPGIDSDVEKWIKSCEACFSVLPSPPKVPVMNWPTPEGPWERVHIDYAGPFHDQYFLIVVDAFSKWIEVSISKSSTSDHSIKSLRDIFARFGIPKEVVSDNGTQFTSETFHTFMRMNGIIHKLTAPGYPATNGAAENAVKTTKNALKRALNDKNFTNFNKALNEFLFDYRTSPHCSTGISPTDALFKYKPRTRLDLLKPPNGEHPNSNDLTFEEKSKFKVNDAVIIKIFKNSNTWKFESATIERVLGPRNFLCKYNNRSVKRHINQIRPRVVNNCRNETKIGNGLNRGKKEADKKVNKSVIKEGVIWFSLGSRNEQNTSEEDMWNESSDSSEFFSESDNEVNESEVSETEKNLTDINLSNVMGNGGELSGYNLRDRESIVKPKRYE